MFTFRGKIDQMVGNIEKLIGFLKGNILSLTIFKYTFYLFSFIGWCKIMFTYF